MSTPTGPDEATRKEETDLMQQVSDAYYQDRAAFATAMKQATGTVDELLKDVERGYKISLS